MKLPKLSFRSLLIILLILLGSGLAVISLISQPSTAPTTPPPSPSPQTQTSRFILTSPEPITPATPEEQAQLDQQTQDDIQYSQTLQQIYQQSPWLKQLPLETPDYRIVYDYNQNSFRIRLLTSENLETIKTQALNQLQNIGVDLQTQSVYFIEPES